MECVPGWSIILLILLSFVLPDCSWYLPAGIIKNVKITRVLFSNARAVLVLDAA